MKYKIFIIITLFLQIELTGQKTIFDKINQYLDGINKEYTEEIIFVSIDKQTLYHIKKTEIIKKYVISSGELGVGNQQGSNKTPLGLHKVKEKFGDKTPENGRMIGRVFYGQIATILKDTSRSKTDDVTSRIMWLDGQEEGYNKGGQVDSYTRYIYIHGTSEEGRLGIPSSHGCIRMKNKDIIELYDKIKLGTLVLIL